MRQTSQNVAIGASLSRRKRPEGRVTTWTNRRQTGHSYFLIVFSAAVGIRNSEAIHL
jgi:hypothetical protein